MCQRHVPSPATSAFGGQRSIHLSYADSPKTLSLSHLHLGNNVNRWPGLLWLERWGNAQSAAVCGPPGREKTFEKPALTPLHARVIVVQYRHVVVGPLRPVCAGRRCPIERLMIFKAFASGGVCHDSSGASFNTKEKRNDEESCGCRHRDRLCRFGVGR